MDQYEFEKFTMSGWKPLSAEQVREELRNHVIGVESTRAMISLSGKTGYFVKQIRVTYRRSHFSKK